MPLWDICQYDRLYVPHLRQSLTKQIGALAFILADTAICYLLKKVDKHFRKQMKQRKQERLKGIMNSNIPNLLPNTYLPKYIDPTFNIFSLCHQCEVKLPKAIR